MSEDIFSPALVFFTNVLTQNIQLVAHHFAGEEHLQRQEKLSQILCKQVLLRKEVGASGWLVAGFRHATSIHFAFMLVHANEGFMKGRSQGEACHKPNEPVRYPHVT